MPAKAPSIDALLEQIFEIGEGEMKISKRDASKLLARLYRELTGQFAPLVHGLPALAGPVAKDVTPVLVAFMDLVTSVGGSPEFEESRNRFVVQRAKKRMATLRAYRDAGFTHEEAFQLLLQDSAQKASLPALPNLDLSKKGQKGER